jgi:hypothetical protein
MGNMFQEAADILAGVEEAQEKLRRDLERACDWENPEDVALYKKEKREGERRALLDRLVPDRKCRCGVVVEQLSAWAINRSKTLAMCRSCYHSIESTDQPMDVSKIFHTPIVRYGYDGEAIAIARKALGVNRRRFAYLAGWTYSYQQKLELNRYETLQLENVRVILGVFDRLRQDTTE